MTEELADIQPMHDTTTGSDLFTDSNASMETLGLKRDKLVDAQMDCPNPMGKNVGLLQWTQVNECRTETSIIDHEMLCKSLI